MSEATITHSAVIVAPEAARAAGNALADGLGWGPGNLVVPLSPTGAAPATHWLCRAGVGPAFLALLADPPEGAAAVLAALAVDLREGADPSGHAAAVMSAMGLARVAQSD